MTWMQFSKHYGNIMTELTNRFDEIALRKEMAKIQKRIVKDRAKLADLTKTLRETCPHEKMVILVEYSEGGYLNTGSETRWKHCAVCGYDGPKQTKSNGRYG